MLKRSLLIFLAASLLGTGAFALPRQTDGGGGSSTGGADPTTGGTTGDTTGGSTGSTTGHFHGATSGGPCSGGQLCTMNGTDTTGGTTGSTTGSVPQPQYTATVPLQTPPQEVSMPPIDAPPSSAPTMTGSDNAEASAWNEIGKARNLFGQMGINTAGSFSSGPPTTTDPSNSGIGTKTNGAGLSNSAGSSASAVDTDRVSNAEAPTAKNLNDSVASLFSGGAPTNSAPSAVVAANAARGPANVNLAGAAAEHKFDGAPDSAPGAGHAERLDGTLDGMVDGDGLLHGRGGAHLMGNGGVDAFAPRKGNPSLFEIINDRYRKSCTGWAP